jgi:hypothetical protein
VVERSRNHRDLMSCTKWTDALRWWAHLGSRSKIRRGGLAAAG